MTRFLLAAMLSCPLAGCGMCQNCNDGTGPVPDSENFGAYYHSPRAGSAFVEPAADTPTSADVPTPAPLDGP